MDGPAFSYQPHQLSPEEIDEINYQYDLMMAKEKGMNVDLVTRGNATTPDK